ncbi:IclR family transcriptional regulator [Frankia sp. CNm7]|uniref:IclR family transcriptional regulator n=1 Tax=Frankia nepalensis TaxID=1836974 RepID=A0A937RG57_9ACTN|nr:IclR family transcriptional regulator [Frankia nepalensis]MBL7495722.1 IclR family transcriptional regulator [Frankia nepalensis]MBL7508996.1 IclR family transcriptional regulator [Frankia nepalensis]MBL7523676.1 IclR family transcriptional regulator [Frankia nepalensis]MBL7629795.1 IclR family transcriptional regulator [Frankia nepalensis]
MAGRTGTPGATLTGRIMAILGAFDDQHTRLGLSDLARRADLPIPTVHRLAGELLRHGALARTDRGYVIGRRMWEIGLLAPIQSTLRETAAPFLYDIHAATRATVHLAVRDDHQVLYLERIAGRTSVPVVSAVGLTLPMHATGVGKALLAHAPEDIRRRVLASLTRVTPYTITQPGRLNEQLEQIRRAGYATTVEEMSLGACSVAVPIHGGGQVVAAIGVVVASLRRDRARLTAALQVAAQGISRQLGAAPPP